MDSLQKISSAIDIYRKEGLDSLADRVRFEAIRKLHRFDDEPEPIWNQDWDLLIVLDACRFDLMESVDNEFDFLDSEGMITSAGSSTIEWIETNFSSEYDSYLSQTAYVTGNPNSIRGFPFIYPDECECGATITPSYDSIYHNGRTVCPNCEEQIRGDRRVPVQILKEVWRDAWDNDIGTIRPRPITDVAIQTARQDNPNKMIVHYMQPHQPFISAPDLDSGIYIAEEDEYREQKSKNIWKKIEDGEINKETAWAEYQNNLRIVLEDVELLLENADFDRTAYVLV